MSTRRALLIGATNYGAGFAPLPAVATDLGLVDRALQARGYEVTVLSQGATESATELINAIEEFCAKCERDNVHVIYFSGHGMLLGNDDCIIPAGADLERVVRRSDLRVPTDLSASLPREHGPRGVPHRCLSFVRASTDDESGSDVGRQQSHQSAG
jgi:hypothetical protein